MQKSSANGDYEHNDELFINEKYEPDISIKDDSEYKQHPYEFNEEENDESFDKAKKDHSDFIEYEK